MTRFRPTAVLLAAICACALALVGCAGPGSPAVQRLAAAPAATAGAGSARVSITVTTHGVDDPAAAEITGEGEIDFAGERGRIVMEMPGMDGTSGTTVETVFLDGVIYSQLPMPEGVQWLRIDTAEVEGAGSSPLGGTSDPRADLAFLGGARDVSEVGEEDVRGAATTHYRFTVDLEAAREASDDDEHRRLIDRVRTQLGTDELPMEVWLDDDGRVRRQRYDLGLAAMHGQDHEVTSGTTTVVEYHDFGLDVDVEPPPEEAIVDIHELDPGFGESTPWQPDPEEAQGPPTAQVLPDDEARDAIEPPSAQKLPDDYDGPDV